MASPASRLGCWAGGRRLAFTLIVVTAIGCAAPVGLAPDEDRLQVITTTTIIRDLVHNVGGRDVQVRSLIPDGADPHTYEPTLRAVRDVVYAQVAFSNYLLLEPPSVIRALDANLSPDALNVSLAEEAVRYGAELITLVQDPALDALWLGLRVSGDGRDLGATRTSEVRLTLTDLDGPGDLVAFVTGSFGAPQVVFDSRDGTAAGFTDDADTAILPPAAHTHLSWAFSEPGVYRLGLTASLSPLPGEVPRRLGSATVTMAVGVDPGSVRAGAEVVDRGHADVTVDLDGAQVNVALDRGGTVGQRRMLDPDRTVIAVPNLARQELPPDPTYRFLGRAGTRIFLLAQSVLGSHLHGEIDPHLWHDLDNAAAYVRIIRDTLSRADPARASRFHERARAYLAKLDELDRRISAELAPIPRSRRKLVTTHDAFRYLAADRDFDVAGFVVPNPAAEPSLADRRRLSETIRNLAVPAVFVEPVRDRRASILREVADGLGVRVCVLRSDTLDGQVRTYAQLMLANARSLRRCLR